MKKVGKIEISGQAVTAPMLTSLFENMKDFIRSEIKSNNVSIRKEINEAVDPLKSDIKQLQVAVMDNRKEIKSLQKDMKDVKDDVQGVKDDICGVKNDMKGMEERLGNKIDKNAIRLDDHETRITTLEEAR